MLVGAERAFNGTLVAREGDRLTFDASEVVRGELPDPLVARDQFAPPWTIRAAPGAELGLVVQEIGGELLVNQCGLVAPARLREAREGGWPRGILRPAQRRVTTTAASIPLGVGCFGRCAGPVALRALDGAVLGRARVDLRRGVRRFAVRLTPTARRRLARDARVPARLVVRLRPAMRRSNTG